MNTDNRTNEPTPEQVEAAMFQLFPITVRYDGCDVPNPGAADKREGFKAGIEYMRGLLSEGAPSEAQARAIRKLDNVQAILAGAQASVTDAVRELSLTSAALTAAQGAARPVNGFDTTAERVKNEADSVHVATQEPCPQPCEHLSAKDAREGRDCQEHPCICPTAPTSDREKQVTDAPETVEVAFKTVEVERLGHLLVQLSPATPRNGAATVRRLMEEMNIKEVVS